MKTKTLRTRSPLATKLSITLRALVATLTASVVAAVAVTAFSNPAGFSLAIGGAAVTALIGLPLFVV